MMFFKFTGKMVFFTYEMKIDVLCVDNHGKMMEQGFAVVSPLAVFQKSLYLFLTLQLALEV